MVGNKPDENDKAFLKDSTNTKGILVQTGYIYSPDFGEADQYYFLYDYDLYD